MVQKMQKEQENILYHLQIYVGAEYNSLKCDRYLLFGFYSTARCSEKVLMKSWIKCKTLNRTLGRTTNKVVKEAKVLVNVIS